MGIDLKRDLRRILVQQGTGKDVQENLLTAVGFSPVILDMKLTEEQIQELALWQAKRILAVHHKDRTGDPELVLQQIGRYSQIHKLLQNEDIFRSALEEFRDQRNEERSEVTQQRRIINQRDEEIRNLTAALANARNELAGAGEVKVVEGRTRTIKQFVYREPDQAMRMRNNQLGMFIGGLGGRLSSPCNDLLAIEQASHVLVLSFRLELTERIGHPTLLDQARKYYEEARQEGRPAYVSKRFESVKEFLNQVHLDVINLEDWLKTAKFNQARLPRLFWSKNASYAHLGFTEMHIAGKGLPGVSLSEFEPFGLTRAELNKLYRNGLEILTQVFDPKTTLIAGGQIVLNCLRVNRGFVWERGSWVRLAGSIFPKNVEFDTTSAHGDTILSTGSVTKFLRPALVKGAFLARQRVGHITIPEGPMEKRIMQFEDRGEFRERPYLVNHIILGCVEDRSVPTSGPRLTVPKKRRKASKLKSKQ